jgi:hypothetical protein
MNKAKLRDKAKLRVSVAKFAGKVDRLREEADRLHESGWRWSVPAHRGELYGLVAGALRGEFIRATKLEGEKGDLRNYSRSGPVGPPPDADGHTILAGRYAGLGSKAMEVQVFILERASKEDTVAMLHKMADRLEDNWVSLTNAERYEYDNYPEEEFSPRGPEDFLSLGGLSR